MPVPKSRIGILSGGGDCAGINPAIKWVVKTAMDERVQKERGIRYEMLGIKDGWEGLVQPEPAQEYLVSLDPAVVRTWDRYGGTMLGTSRTNPYDRKNNRSKLVLSNIDKLGLDALVVIGGDDTLGVAHKLAGEGVNVIGIPKTIDKDLCETEYTLGFETALDVITQEVDRLRTTAGSHKRIFVIETMGRHAGWLALEGGESSGAYIILIPEHDFSVAKVNELVLEGRQAGTRYDIILVAEGAKPAGYAEFAREERLDAFGHKMLGGVAEFLARYFGITAVDLVNMRDFDKMVCYRGGRITACPLEKVVGRVRRVDVSTLYDVERYNGRRTILTLGPAQEKRSETGEYRPEVNGKKSNLG
jgi:6-phosphofructokinase 1